MTRSLDQLPFDLIFCIAFSLDLEDVVHLGQTCRQLKDLLDERTLYRRTAEASKDMVPTTFTCTADIADRSTTRIPKKLDKHGQKKLRTNKPSRLSTTENMLCQLRTLSLRKSWVKEALSCIVKAQFVY
jgi:hypothetical protein